MQTMAGLLPGGVAAVEAVGELPHQPALGEELAALGPTSDRRRQEFAAGRTCARRALAALGMPPVAILPGPGRRPLWPAGAVGSITHCPGYVAAAVGPAARFASLGIDAEPHLPLPRGVLRRIATGDELAMITALGGPVHWDRVLFSAKESVYKAWHPLAGRGLGFRDVSVAIDPAAGTFRARPLVDQPPVDHFDGHLAVAGDLVLTAVAVERKDLRT